jgi:hypothetical protein
MGSMDDLCIEAETFQEILLSTGRRGYFPVRIDAAVMRLSQTVRRARYV